MNEKNVSYVTLHHSLSELFTQMQTHFIKHQNGLMMYGLKGEVM